jgi:hypothetical protein
MAKKKPNAPVAAKAVEPKAPTLAEKIEEYLRLKDTSDRTFKRMNAALAEITAELAPGQEIATRFGTVALVDLWAGKSIVFKNTSFARFQLQVQAARG